MWDKISYPFPNVNFITVNLWELISNFTRPFIGHVIIPTLELKLICVSERDHGRIFYKEKYELTSLWVYSSEMS